MLTTKPTGGGISLVSFRWAPACMAAPCLSSLLIHGGRGQEEDVQTQTPGDMFDCRGDQDACW